MGSGKKQTTGYRYSMTLQMGICLRPDALLEIRAGGRQAWTGEVSTNSVIYIDAPELFGGDKREGGIQGDCDVLLGADDQAPDGWLGVVQGEPQPGLRGFLSLVYRGLIASNNPYIKPWSVRVRSIKAGWTSPGGCWYPEKAAVVIEPGPVFIDDMAFSALDATLDATYAGVTIDSGFTADDIIIVDKPAGLTYPAWSHWNTDSQPLAGGLPWGTEFWVTANGVDTKYWDGHYPTALAAEASRAGQSVQLTGATSYTFWLYDTPVTDNRGGLSLRVYKNGRLAMNPVHIIYQCLTDTDWGMGYPEAVIDDASFRAAADTLFAEGFGLCLKWNNQETIGAFIQTIADHAGLVVGQDRKTGLFRIVLLRDDYDIDDLPVFTKKDVRVVRYQRPSMADTVNEVIVVYTDIETGEDTPTTPLQNLANIQGQGRIVSSRLSFAGLPTFDLASRVAMRELRARSTPLWQVQLEFKRKAYDLFPGEPFVVDLTDHPIGAKLVIRAGEIDYGTTADSIIRADCVEDAFGLPSASYVVAPGDNGGLPSTAPVPATTTAFEVPYVELAQAMSAADLDALPTDAGYLGATAAKPSSSAMNFTLATRIPPAVFTDAGSGDFAPTGTLAVAVDKDDLDLVLSAGAIDLDQLEIDSAAFLGEHPNAELVRIDAVDTTTLTVTVARGCGDTVPQAWAIGTRLWGYDAYLAGDVQQYVAGETVEAKVLPRTATGTLAEADATAASVTMASRQARPYPPGAVTFNGATWPASDTAPGTYDVAWAHRDRALQADTLIDFTAASVGPEPGTRYTLRVKRADTLALLVEATNMGGTSARASIAYAGNIRFELLAVNDVGESWQKHVHIMACPGGGDNTITGYTPYDPTDSETVIDGGVVGPTPPTSPVGPSPLIGGTGVASVIAARTHGSTVVDPVTYGASTAATAAVNTAAFNAAYAALPTSGVNQGGIVRPSVAGTYLIDPNTSIKPLSYTQLDLGAAGVTLQESYTATDHKYGVWVDGKTQVEIVGGRIIGYRDAWSAISGTTSEWGHGVFINNGSTAVSIKNCSISKAVGDAVSVGYTCTDVKIDQCVLTNCRRQGVSVGGDTVRVTNTEISYISGTSPQAGIDFEPDYPATSTGGVVDNCHIHHCTGPSVQMYKRGNSVTVQNCVLEYCNRGVYSIDSTGGVVKDNTIRYHHNGGVYLKGTSTGWTIGGTGDTNAFYGNKTATYGTPAAGGATTSVTGQNTVTAKHLTVDATASATVGANTYGPV